MLVVEFGENSLGKIQKKSAETVFYFSQESFMLFTGLMPDHKNLATSISRTLIVNKCSPRIHFVILLVLFVYPVCTWGRGRGY